MKSIFSFSQTNSVITATVPDTITSWAITAFSIDPMTGLAVTKQPTKLTVFQPFFVSMNLPYSIKRGEIVSIPISVFNYMEDEDGEEATITLYNDDLEFEFIDSKEEIFERGRPSKERTKTVVVRQHEASTSFKIRASKIGSIKIKVVAKSVLAEGDGVERYLLVKAEGITHYMNSPIFVDLRNSPEFSKDMQIHIPSDEVVPDSIQIEASIIGDILGLPIGNVNKLM